MVLSHAAVWVYSKLINEHAPTMGFQNHDVWMHMLFGRSPQSVLRVHCPGFHQFGFWHLVPFSEPWLSTRYHNTGYSGALERVGPRRLLKPSSSRAGAPLIPWTLAPRLKPRCRC